MRNRSIKGLCSVLSLPELLCAYYNGTAAWNETKHRNGQLVIFPASCVFCRTLKPGDNNFFKSLCYLCQFCKEQIIDGILISLDFNSCFSFPAHSRTRMFLSNAVTTKQLDAGERESSGWLTLRESWPFEGIFLFYSTSSQIHWPPPA